MEQQRAKEKYICILVIALFAVLIGLRLFYRLGDIGLQDEDEAWHAVNAYEMYHDHRLVIHSFAGEVDYYNTKPPLGLWAMMASFSVFGVSMFSMKFASALFAFLTFTVLCTFLAEKYSLRAAAVFSAAFLSLGICYNYHMFRNGNFDSLFAFLFTLAVLALYGARKDNRFVIAFGFLVGLAFLTKAQHAGVIFLIGVLYIPALRGNWKWRNFFGAAAAGAFPVAVWAVRRYRFDSLKFFQAMAGEVDGETRSGLQLEYLADLIREPVIVALLVVAAAYFAAAFFLHRTKRGEGDALFWLWFAFPVVFNILIGSFHVWYIYPSYIAAAFLLGIYADRLPDILPDKMAKAGILVAAVMLVVSAGFGALHIAEYKNAGLSGGPSMGYFNDLREFKQKHGDRYDGSRIYIQNLSRYEESRQIDFWHDDLVCYSDYLCDFSCREGGVEAWLSDEEALLVLNKDLWSEYEGVLTGYVILQDNGYLYFSHDRY